MPRFQFRLATLLRLRAQYRDELQGRLAEAYEAQRLLAKQCRGLEVESETLRGLQRQLVAAKSPDVSGLLEAQRYALVLQGRHATLADQVRQLEGEIERRRQAVVEADRQVRALDRLHDHQRAEFDREQLRRDQRVMDEIAGRRRGGDD